MPERKIKTGIAIFGDDRGIALVTLITLVVLFGLLALAVSILLNQNSASTPVEISSLRALYLAEAGLNDSFWELKYGAKLYDQSIPLGRIDTRAVYFHDGSSGQYYVPEPSTEIIATGASGGVTRRVRVAVINDLSNFALYTIDSRDVTFDKNVEVAGNVFINGNLTVNTPTKIDTNAMTLYLEQSNEAHYRNGTLFPSVSLEEQPSPPFLDTSWYDSLLNVASGQPSGNEKWGSTTLQDTIYINGNLTIKKKASIGRAAGCAVVVVNGSVKIENKATLADSIYLIAKDGIAIGRNVEIGETKGASGNLCFTKSGTISIGQNCSVNGAVVSNNKVSINLKAEVKGLIYAKKTASLNRKGIYVMGAAWIGKIKKNLLTKNSKILYEQSYIPVKMPPGLTPPASVGSFRRLANSWREVR